jgi:hypothetical protein
VLFGLLSVFGRGDHVPKTPTRFAKTFCKNKTRRPAANFLQMFCFEFLAIDTELYYCEMISSGRAKRIEI